MSDNDNEQPSPFPVGHAIGVGDYEIASETQVGDKVLGYSTRFDKFREFKVSEVSA